MECMIDNHARSKDECMIVPTVMYMYMYTAKNI